MIREKLQLLQAAEIIDQETGAMVLDVQDYLTQVLTVRDEQLETFLVHLAMADMRRKHREVPDFCMEAPVLAELHSHPHYNRARQLWQDLAQRFEGPDFATVELDFFYLHLLALFEGGSSCS